MHVSTPINENKKRHGFWHVDFMSGDVMFKGHYVNNVELGYWINNLGEKDATLYYAR